MKPRAPRRHVLVTGAGGGLGAATVRRLTAAGWQVFAADLTPPKVAAGVVPLSLDVTNDAAVEQAIALVAANTTGLQGVVHFAGILRVGALMDFDAAALQAVFDVNVLGAHRVTRAALPLLRQGRGRVILISSETGVQSGAPFNGPYGMSKHAVEAYGDSLRRELMFLRVPVIKVQPGPFRTAMVESVLPAYETAAAHSEHFSKLMTSVLKRLPIEQAKAHDPDILASVVERALTSRAWRAEYLVRPDRRRMMLDRLTPRTADLLLRIAIRKMASTRPGQQGA